MGGQDEQIRLGEILVRKRLLSRSGLSRLLDAQKDRPTTRLATLAVEAGIAELEVLKALSDQQGVPGLDLDQLVIPLENIELLPLRVMRQHQIMPIVVEDESMLLAMADPSDKSVIEEIEFTSGKNVHPYVVLQGRLRSVLDTCLHLKAKGRSHFVGANADPAYLKELGIEDQVPSQALPLQMESTLAHAGAPPPPPPAARKGKPRASEPAAILRQIEPPSVEEPIVADEEMHPALQSRPRPATPTIMVVDDESDIRKMMSCVFVRKGYEVVEAASGEEVLVKLKGMRPDVMILDAMLPGMHGFELCTHLREDVATEDIPIIMASAVHRGWRFAEDVRTRYAVRDYLEKPFKIADLLIAVEAVFGDAPSNVDDEKPSAIAEALSLYQEGRLDDAIKRLESALEGEPLQFELRLNLGLMRARNGDSFAAIRELETAIEVQPRSFSALRNLAVLYEKVGFPKKAVELWERAMSATDDENTRREIRERLIALL